VQLERGLELITVRYETPEALEKLRQGRTVVYEKRLPRTVQWVARKS
jgi:hypothetical protein